MLLKWLKKEGVVGSLDNIHSHSLPRIADLPRGGNKRLDTHGLARNSSITRLSRVVWLRVGGNIIPVDVLYFEIFSNCQEGIKFILCNIDLSMIHGVEDIGVQERMLVGIATEDAFEERGCLLRE